MNPHAQRACAVVGLGGVGLSFLATVQADPRWLVRYACDLRMEARTAASALAPGVIATADLEGILADPEIAMVILTTRADARPDLIRRCLAAGKHIIAEKPLACTSDEEDALCAAIATSGLHVAVNLPNRHAWYHDLAWAAIRGGDIGQIAAIGISHQTQGGLPDALHPKPEGPPFANCGMHYIDLLRWFAGAEPAAWHAQGLRLWGHEEPWWVTVNGRCANDVAFHVTEGMSWAQGCPERTNRSHLELHGTTGAIVISHDFRTVTVEVHGRGGTRRTVGSYGGKHLDILLERFTCSLAAGANLGYATARDCARSSRLARAMLAEATTSAGTAIGTSLDLAAIRRCKALRDD